MTRLAICNSQLHVQSIGTWQPAGAYSRTSTQLHVNRAPQVEHSAHTQYSACTRKTALWHEMLTHVYNISKCTCGFQTDSWRYEGNMSHMFAQIWITNIRTLVTLQQYFSVLMTFGCVLVVLYGNVARLTAALHHVIQHKLWISSCTYME